MKWLFTLAIVLVAMVSAASACDLGTTRAGVTINSPPEFYAEYARETVTSYALLDLLFVTPDNYQYLDCLVHSHPYYDTNEAERGILPVGLVVMRSHFRPNIASTNYANLVQHYFPNPSDPSNITFNSPAEPYAAWEDQVSYRSDWPQFDVDILNAQIANIKEIIGPIAILSQPSTSADNLFATTENTLVFQSLESVPGKNWTNVQYSSDQDVTTAFRHYMIEAGSIVVEMDGDLSLTRVVLPSLSYLPSTRALNVRMEYPVATTLRTALTLGNEFDSRFIYRAYPLHAGILINVDYNRGRLANENENEMVLYAPNVVFDVGRLGEGYTDNHLSTYDDLEFYVNTPCHVWKDALSKEDPAADDFYSSAIHHWVWRSENIIRNGALTHTGIVNHLQCLSTCYTPDGFLNPGESIEIDGCTYTCNDAGLTVDEQKMVLASSYGELDIACCSTDAECGTHAVCTNQICACEADVAYVDTTSCPRKYILSFFLTLSFSPSPSPSFPISSILTPFPPLHHYTTVPATPVTCPTDIQILSTTSDTQTHFTASEFAALFSGVTLTDGDAILAEGGSDQSPLIFTAEFAEVTAPTTCDVSYYTVDTNAPVLSALPTGGNKNILADGVVLGSELDIFGVSAVDHFSGAPVSVGRYLSDCLSLDTSTATVVDEATEFQRGTHTICLYAQDNSGNAIFHEFTFSAIDTEAPVVTAASLNLFQAEGDSSTFTISSADLFANYANFDVTDNDVSALPTVVIKDTAGNVVEPVVVNVGPSNTVTLVVSATDASGNAGNSVTFTLAYYSTDEPTLTYEANTVLTLSNCETNPTGVSYTPTASIATCSTGDCTLSPFTTSNALAPQWLITPVNGNPHTVSWTVTDNILSKTVTFEAVVRVNDNCAPTFVSCESTSITNSYNANGVVEAGPDGKFHTSITADGVDADDNYGDPQPTSVPSGAETFDIGEHEIVWSAVDSFGNSATCSHLFTVIDATAPTIDSFSVSSGTPDAGCSGDASAKVTYSVSATFSDNSDVQVTPVVSCDSFATVSGFLVHVLHGQTSACTLTVTDGAGLSTSTSFSVVGNFPVCVSDHSPKVAQDVVEHDVVSFSVAAEGFPAPTYQWKQIQADGSTINVATTANYNFAASSTSSGLYYAVVTNTVDGIVHEVTTPQVRVTVEALILCSEENTIPVGDACVCEPGYYRNHADPTGPCVAMTRKGKCHISGDPHFRSFDGLDFDFQREGEHVLFRPSAGYGTNPGHDLEIQTCNYPAYRYIEEIGYGKDRDYDYHNGITGPGRRAWDAARTAGFGLRKGDKQFALVWDRTRVCTHFTLFVNHRRYSIYNDTESAEECTAKAFKKREILTPSTQTNFRDSSFLPVGGEIFSETDEISVRRIKKDKFLVHILDVGYVSISVRMSASWVLPSTHKNRLANSAVLDINLHKFNTKFAGFTEGLCGVWDNDCRNDLRSPDGFSVAGTDSLEFRHKQKCFRYRKKFLNQANNDGSSSNRQMVEDFGASWQVSGRSVLSMNCLDHTDSVIPPEEDAAAITLEEQTISAEATECCKRYGVHTDFLEACVTDLSTSSLFPQYTAPENLDCSEIFNVDGEDDKWVTSLCYTAPCNVDNVDEDGDIIDENAFVSCSTTHAATGNVGESWATGTVCNASED